MLDKPCIHGLTPRQQTRYQPVTDCSYLPVLVYFNNWNIITFSHKATTSESFEEIHQAVLDGIGDNMTSLVQSGKYEAINTTDTSTIIYYAISFVSETYTLQEDTTCDKKIFSSQELILKAQYLIFIQENTNWYWEHKKNQQVIISPKTNYCAYMS